MLTELTQCVCCNSKNIDLVFDMENLPLAGSFSASFKTAISCDLYPHKYVQCADCGTVFSRYSIDTNKIYSNYNYNSSEIPSLVRHFKHYSNLLREEYKGDINFLEIGCNSGVLLDLLPRKWNLIGVDPSDVALRCYNIKEDPAYILCAREFNSSFANLAGKIDVVSGSNCLAHFPNLYEAFTTVHTILKDGGDFWLEVKALEPALSQFRYTDFYIEHLAVHSLNSLKFCLGKIGFNYINHALLPFHGGLLRVRFRKEKPTQLLNNPNLFKDEFAAMQMQYNHRYEHEKVKKMFKRQIVGYGASGECTCFLNHFKHLPVKYVIDEAPSKEGKFIPHTGQKIKNRENLLKESSKSICLITAGAYYNEIVKKNGEFRGTFENVFNLLK